MLENLMVVGAQAHFERHFAADAGLLQFSLEEARARFLRSMDVSDVCGELEDDAIADLIRSGNANAVGRYVIATMNAWADRLAAREMLA